MSPVSVPGKPLTGRPGYAHPIETIGMVGVDYQSAPLAIRETLAIPSDELASSLEKLGEIADEGFILSTCNRTEIYASLKDADSAEQLQQLLADLRGLPRHAVDAVTTIRSGRQAVEHLFAVSTGLTSMMIGEPHVLAQVRNAMDAARSVGTLGPLFSRGVEAALRVGKRARSETGITRNSHSIPHAAAGQILQHLDTPERSSVVIVGAGQMAGHTARLLHHAGIGELVILNRSLLRAEALAHAVGGRFGSLESLPSEISRSDAVVFAVSVTGEYMLECAALSGPTSIRSGPPLVMVDLGVPRSVNPSLRDLANVRLIDIDDLGQAQSSSPATRDEDLLAITGMIAEEADRYAAWLEARAASATIAALQEHVEQIRLRELDRALRRLGSLSDRDREVVSALSVGLVGKVLHEPIVHLREDVAGFDQTVQRLFGLDAPSDTLHSGV